MKHTDLINHFRSFISTEPERKVAVKAAFKSYVDSVAVVNVENGEKYVCLRKRFRGSVKREDGHHGPDSAAVLETSLSAVVTHDNRKDNCLARLSNRASLRATRSTPPSRQSTKMQNKKYRLPRFAQVRAHLRILRKPVRMDQLSFQPRTDPRIKRKWGISTPGALALRITPGLSGDQMKLCIMYKLLREDVYRRRNRRLTEARSYTLHVYRRIPKKYTRARTELIRVTQRASPQRKHARRTGSEQRVDQRGSV